MQAQFAEFFEDIYDALRECVRHIGGNKKVGPILWPELSLESAANRLRDSLSADKRDKLSLDQALLILKMSREKGFHGAMDFVAFSSGYEPPRPITPQDQEAELQTHFIDAVRRLESIQKQMQAVQHPRRVA